MASLLTLTTASAALRGVFLSHPASRVFDEVYSPVFAWKILRGETFFDVHPLLAQLPQAIGLLFFGDTPLGWRFSAWLWGSFFIAGIGVFGYVLTGERRVGILASLLAVLDIAFFVYGRTGLPDMFLLATFVWAFALFFLSGRTRRPLGALLAALGSGVLLGNLVATKWLGMGALALVWAWVGLAALAGYWQKGTVVSCPLPRVRRYLMPVIFLVLPIVIYLLWMIPLVGIPGRVPAVVGESLFQSSCVFGRNLSSTSLPPTTWLGRVRHWHCTVWNYHAYLDAKHPYASPWWSWPLLRHPVLFYLDGSRRISATGNPILWWGGSAFVLFTVGSIAWRAVQRVGRRAHRSLVATDHQEALRSRCALLVDLWLVLGVLGFWLPWVFIQRVAFHYHYFLSFTLTLILLALWLTRLLERPAFRPLVVLFPALAAGAFVYLYPAATATSAFWTR